MLLKYELWLVFTENMSSLISLTSTLSHLPPPHNYWKKCTLIGHRAELSSALFSYDGSLITTGSMEKTYKLWKTDSRKCIATL